MSDVLYSIKEQTLTDIADALRNKHGATEVISTELETKVSKTPNATGFETFEGKYGASKTEVITISGAKKIKIKIAYHIGAGAMAPDSLRIAAGEHSSVNPDNAVFQVSNSAGMEELEIDGDTVTFYLVSSSGGRALLGYYAECTGYGDQEVKRTYKSSEMAAAINAIELGDVLPDEAFNVSGDCSYRFANGGWDWFIEKYGDRVVTNSLYDGDYMFYDSDVSKIPFELNFDNNRKISLSRMFSMCQSLTEVPKINNCVVNDLSNVFNFCSRLRELPEDIADWFDWSYIEALTSSYGGDMSSMFPNCYSLRSVPMNLFKHVNPYAGYSYSYLKGSFTKCWTLDELIDLPIPYVSTWTSSGVGSVVDSCCRLKNFTFAMPDGQPYVVNWKSQTLDFSVNVGFGASYDACCGYNSGIVYGKEVKDDNTYQKLKDDDDWWTNDLAYSRYNHDSAVATINSLPDTSAYLATAGGTNTIKYKGGAGSKTDGGAINTLTAEEIAIAASRGWTVTLV